MSVEFTEHYSKGSFWRKGFHSFSIEINGEEIESVITMVNGSWAFKSYGDFEEFSSCELRDIADYIDLLNVTHKTKSDGVK